MRTYFRRSVDVCFFNIIFPMDYVPYINPLLHEVCYETLLLKATLIHRSSKSTVDICGGRYIAQNMSSSGAASVLGFCQRSVFCNEQFKKLSVFLFGRDVYRRRSVFSANFTVTKIAKASQ